MMTTAESAELLNKKVLFHYHQGEFTNRGTPADPVYFPVVVTEVRTAFGRRDVQVAPIDGTGRFWTRIDRLLFEDDIVR
ncbi:MAG: hypothetical protein ACREK8_03240 [Gemmatimonadales bacterium]